MKRKKVFSRDNRFVGEDLRRGMWWEDEEGTESVENPVNFRAGSRLLLTVQVQVGKMEYGKRGCWSARESFWEISSRKFDAAGAKCEG